MSKKPVMVVCGTRPEIIKMAPVYHALQASEALAPVLVHTGQHTDLAFPLYDFFGMQRAEDLVLERQKPTLAHLSQALLGSVSEAIVRQRPAAVLVHGDTTSASMAALAAFYEQIPVGHVEAGLRTGDKYSPFPEELNRSLIGRIADWHFAPTRAAQEALAREGIVKDVLVTGNTVIDAAQLTAARQAQGAVAEFVRENSLAARCAGKRLVLVTAHRRENWGEGLANIANAVADLLAEHEDLLVVWPLHANPAVAQAVREVLARRQCDEARTVLCAPLDYDALIWLLSHAWATLTDSGGIQEEAAAFGTPVFVLRESTERPELIEAGGGVLVGAVRERITTEFNRVARSPGLWQGMRHIVNPFGDGRAGARIVEFLADRLG